MKKRTSKKLVISPTVIRNLTAPDSSAAHILLLSLPHRFGIMVFVYGNLIPRRRTRLCESGWNTCVCVARGWTL
jgi:hypothetical protein